MPKLSISEFSGEVPRRSDTLLRDNEAVSADNVRLYSGELRSWRGAAEEFEPATTDVQTIYLFRNPILDSSLWLTWDSLVYAQKSSLADNTDFRLYYTGDGVPKKTRWAIAGTGTPPVEYPNEFFHMGVPAPTTKPTVALNATGSSLNADSRYYVYTYVSTFGSLTEESAPSPVSDLVTIAASDSVDVSGMLPSPSGTDYNITHIRIYRTVPGEQTIGSYLFVTELDLTSFDPTTDTYNDDQLATELGEPLSTVGWTTPPDDMTGLVAMANGMMAGFVGNTVYFCEPYFHHAWPIEYAQSIPDQIVGLGAYGNTLIVLTEGQPWAMVGVSPDALSVEQIPMPEPCISAKSIAVDKYGVMYASPNGLVSIGPQGRGVITNELFRRKEWQEYSPETMVGAIYDGKYFATFESLGQGNRTMVVSRDDIPALTFLEIRARAFLTDVQEGDLYYLNTANDIIYKLDADPLNPYIYEWTSKRFHYPHGVTWALAKVDADTVQIANNEDYNALVAQVIAANQAITGDILGSVNSQLINEYTIGGSLLSEIPDEAALLECTLFFLGENDEVLGAINIDDFETRKIPPFRTRSLKLRLNGTLNIRGVSVATDMPSMRGAG